MKLLAALALSATASQVVFAAVLPQNQKALNYETPLYNTERYLIELGPYQTRWVTEEEKWALKLVHIPLFPIISIFTVAHYLLLRTRMASISLILPTRQRLLITRSFSPPTVSSIRQG